MNSIANVFLISSAGNLLDNDKNGKFFGSSVNFVFPWKIHTVNDGFHGI